MSLAKEKVISSAIFQLVEILSKVGVEVFNQYNIFAAVNGGLLHAASGG
jgi:hypothetical protein